MHRVPTNGSVLLVVFSSRPTSAIYQICFFQAHCKEAAQIGILDLGVANKTGRVVQESVLNQ